MHVDSQLALGPAPALAFMGLPERRASACLCSSSRRSRAALASFSSLGWTGGKEECRVSRTQSCFAMGLQGGGRGSMYACVCKHAHGLPCVRLLNPLFHTRRYAHPPTATAWCNVVQFELVKTQWLLRAACTPRHSALVEASWGTWPDPTTSSCPTTHPPHRPPVGLVQQLLGGLRDAAGLLNDLHPIQWGRGEGGCGG